MVRMFKQVKLEWRNSSSAELAERNVRDTLGGLAVFFVLACVVLACSWPKQWLLALLWAFAFDAVGVLGGFLFGIPRVQQSTGAGEATGPRPSEPPKPPYSTDEHYQLGINTNLEQVSDWLTKIIVGVGLVELKSMSSYLSRMARYVGESFAAGVGNDQHAAAIIVFFTTWGFLSGFLITRMYFTGAFARLDQSALGLNQNLPPPENAIDLGTIGESEPQLKELKATQAAAIDQTSLLSAEKMGISVELWAKVKLANREYLAAAEGYQAAIAERPNDPLLRFEHATALFLSDPQHVDQTIVNRARLDLLEALRLIKRNPPQISNDVTRIYLSLGYVSLYAEPKGFETSIQVLEEFLLIPGTTPEAESQARFNLACAYAQRAANVGRSAPEFGQARQMAFDSLQKSLELNPLYRARARELMLPHDSAFIGDNDFVIFQDDSDFKKLLD